MPVDRLAIGSTAARASVSRASLLPGAAPPRHLKLTGAAPAFGFERCEDESCTVEPDGTASSCGRLACPSCGCGGTNLATVLLLEAGDGLQIRCSCGHTWLREPQRSPLLTGFAASS